MNLSRFCRPSVLTGCSLALLGIALVFFYLYLPSIVDLPYESALCDDEYLVVATARRNRVLVFDQHFRRLYDAHNKLPSQKPMGTRSLIASKRAPFVVVVTAYSQELLYLQRDDCNRIDFQGSTIVELCDDFDTNQTFVTVLDGHGKKTSYLLNEVTGQATLKSIPFQTSLYSRLTSYTARINSKVFNGLPVDRLGEARRVGFLPVAASYVESKGDFESLFLHIDGNERVFLPEKFRGSIAVGFKKIVVLGGGCNLMSLRVNEDGTVERDSLPEDFRLDVEIYPSFLPIW